MIKMCEEEESKEFFDPCQCDGSIAQWRMNEKKKGYVTQRQLTA